MMMIRIFITFKVHFAVLIKEQKCGKSQNKGQEMTKIQIIRHRCNTIDALEGLYSGKMKPMFNIGLVFPVYKPSNASMALHLMQ